MLLISCKIMRSILVKQTNKPFLFFFNYLLEKTKRFYHLQKGVLNNTSQKVKIYSRTVNPGQSNFKSISHRLKLLFEGFNDGYILADNIFLDKKFHSQNYELYIIEPDFSDNSGKYQQLDIYLKKNPTQSLKKQIFKNLLIIIKKLHESGLAHLSLNPKNIWIEDETLVYMRPFMIDLFEINEKVNKSCLNNKNCSFYRSPEETFISDYISKSKNYSFLIKCDLWALGCIFSELFLPNLRYPLFYTKDAEEKLFKFFEVLQFPEKKEIPFLDENYYNEIERILKKKPKNSTQDKNLLTFLKKTMLLEGKIILGFLIFDPKKRQDCKTLLISDFFQNSALSSDEKNKISKRLFSSSKSKKTKQFSRDDYFEKEIPLSEEFELSEEESFEKMNKIIIKKKTEYESFSENLDECIDEKNNSFLTNNSQSDDFLNSPQFKTPQIDKKFISLQKNSDDNKKIKQNPKIFSSKSLFLTNKEPIESTNITNLTNISKYKENKEIKESNSNLANKMKFKEKKIWFEIKLLKVFVFQGIKHSEISVQLARKTRNSVIQQDLINYVIILDSRGDNMELKNFL